MPSNGKPMIFFNKIQNGLPFFDKRVCTSNSAIVEWEIRGERSGGALAFLSLYFRYIGNIR